MEDEKHQVLQNNGTWDTGVEVIRRLFVLLPQQASRARNVYTTFPDPERSYSANRSKDSSIKLVLLQYFLVNSTAGVQGIKTFQCLQKGK